MSNIVKLVQGDDLPGITFTIRDANRAADGQELDRKDPSTWRPLNLTGCTLSAAVSRTGENKQIDTVLAVIANAVQGLVLLHLDDCTFINSAGSYDCEITVRFPSGQQTVYDMLTFDVRERINAPQSN